MQRQNLGRQLRQFGANRGFREISVRTRTPRILTLTEISWLSLTSEIGLDGAGIDAVVGQAKSGPKVDHPGHHNVKSARLVSKMHISVSVIFVPAQ